MKTQTLISTLFLVIILIFQANSILGQKKFEFKGIGISGGIYSPAMTYWNNNSPIKNWDKKYETAMLLNLKAEADYKPMRFRLEGGFWQSTAEQNTIDDAMGGGSQSLKIRIIPVSIQALYEIPIKYTQLIPYTGIGLGMNFISQDFKHAPSIGDDLSSKGSGFDYMFLFVEGVDFPVGKNFLVGLEIRYLLGKYVQETKNTAGNIIEENVSIAGPQFCLSFSYLFRKKE